MNLIGLLICVSVIVQALILIRLKRIVKELKTGNQILELTQHLKTATDNLQAAIKAQSQPKQKEK